MYSVRWSLSFRMKGIKSVWRIRLSKPNSKIAYNKWQVFNIDLLSFIIISTFHIKLSDQKIFFSHRQFWRTEEKAHRGLRERRETEKVKTSTFKTHLKLHYATIPSVLIRCWHWEKLFYLEWHRVAEHNSELQKEDLDKEIAALKEENRRLRDEKIQLEAKAEEDTQIKKEFEEQLGQFAKHVKVDSVTDKWKMSVSHYYKNAFFLNVLFV